MGIKSCADCKKSLPVSEFAKGSKQSKSEFYAYCRLCSSRRRKLRPHRPNPLKDFRNALAEYGLTIEAYEALLNNQKYVGAICGLTNKNGRRLGVDHCHKTGKVRGLLCTTCNSGLGHFKDDRQLLAQAS